jgi:hypothetical protein
MAQLHTRGIERDRAGFGGHHCDLVLGHKQELGLVVDEARNQPRTRHAIDMHV